jgi:hypothetical protein
MNSNRRALQILFAASLGMPGVVLCVAGFGAWVYAVIGLGLQPDRPLNELMITMAAGGGAILLGFLMFASVDLMNGAARYRMPHRSLMICLGLELLVIATLMASFTTLAGTLSAMAFGGISWKWIAALVLATAAPIAAIRRLRSFRRELAAETLERLESYKLSQPSR